MNVSPRCLGIAQTEGKRPEGWRKRSNVRGRRRRERIIYNSSWQSKEWDGNWRSRWSRSCKKRKNFRRVEGIGKMGKGSREWPLAALENFAALSSKFTRKFISRVPRLRCAKGYDAALVPYRTRFETETSISER